MRTLLRRAAQQLVMLGVGIFPAHRGRLVAVTRTAGPTREAYPMDADRFDTLARTLTAAGSRRQALVATLGGGLSLVLGAASVDEAGAKKRCPPCKKRKLGKCKKKLPDGTACSGGTCQAGACCLPESPETTCAGRCGTWPNTCRQTVSCPPCAGGMYCLANGSCAKICLAQEDCPAGCGCPMSVEGPRHCVVLGTPSCALIPQVCTATAECPAGWHCQLTGCPGPNGNPEYRCVPLCGL